MLGFKVYYEKATGDVILTIPEKHNANATETTKEQDFNMFDVLSARSPETVSLLQLAYGYHRDDFQKANSWKVDVESEEIMFQYPVFESSHSEKIDQLNSEIGELLLDSAIDKSRITELEISQGDLLLEIAQLKNGGAA